MEIGSNQPPAKGKGVHREVESERSRRQTSGLRNTNRIRHIMGTRNDGTNLHDKSCEIILQVCGKQFDSDIVKVFLEFEKEFDMIYKGFRNS